ncbi:NAD(P)-dependent oxidoreductase [Rhodococcus coprophilus]|uniref:6-phosphogluconate dehydrogenase n=1 Tax=Rhodococcus coprophilus TaxID=38310 RepID=A0A2X4U7C1_9NOCA|nr:NAD(P)-dependent oxidoreductase [Rhodococcus coprophilus]MBM7458115.1 3-hydroxyisobutyrate dehydrogenase-like beta-hydroxyacid dehydrogenase [Rhodococcus coprophilus]SQI31148.1 6-phosphogluconate dehydrogenase [Rhodococcus coprophilus]
MSDPGGLRIGYIGLGNMGAPMAQRLLGRPGGLTVLDTRPEAVAPFVEAGATAATDTAELAAACDLICVTVLDDAQVRDVVAGTGGLLSTARPGTVIAVHSTISDTTATELAAQCAEAGVDLVDAPVSGGAPGARNGTLAVMVGATDEAFAKVAEPFGHFAEIVIHAGPVGSGTRMKLARNLLHFISFTAATEAQRLAEAAGIDITELGKVVRHTDAITGGAGAIMWRDNTSQLGAADSWFPIFSHVRDLGEKDLSLALDLGERLGVELPLATRALAGLGVGLGVGTGSTAQAHASEEHA